MIFNILKNDILRFSYIIRTEKEVLLMDNSTKEKKQKEKVKIVVMKRNLHARKDTLFFLRMFARAYMPVQL